MASLEFWKPSFLFTFTVFFCSLKKNHINCWNFEFLQLLRMNSSVWYFRKKHLLNDQFKPKSSGFWSNNPFNRTVKVFLSFTRKWQHYLRFEYPFIVQARLNNWISQQCLTTNALIYPHAAIWDPRKHTTITQKMLKLFHVYVTFCKQLFKWPCNCLLMKNSQVHSVLCVLLCNYFTPSEFRPAKMQSAINTAGPHTYSFLSAFGCWGHIPFSSNTLKTPYFLLLVLFPLTERLLTERMFFIVITKTLYAIRKSQ